MVASWQCIFKPWNQLRLYFWRILCLFMFSVPRDDFPIGLAHFSCMKLICHKIHPSFINKMNERCVALVLLVNGSKIDNIFKDAKSLALICILPSCDIISWLWVAHSGLLCSGKNSQVEEGFAKGENYKFNNCQPKKELDTPSNTPQIFWRCKHCEEETWEKHYPQNTYNSNLC